MNFLDEYTEEMTKQKQLSAFRVFACMSYIYLSFLSMPFQIIK